MEHLTQYPPANPPHQNYAWGNQPAAAPTPLYYPPSTASVPPPAPKKSFKWLWWTIGIVVLLGLGGGGYYASSQGLVSIPFLPSSGSLVKNIVSQYSGMSAMTSELTLSVKSTSTSAAATPAPEATNNFNIGLGTANLKADLGQTEVTVTATSYAEPSKAWNDSNSETRLIVKAKFMGLNINAAATVRKIGAKAYVQLEKLDGYEAFDISKIRGKWIEVDSQDTTALGANDNVNAGQFDSYIRDFERFVTIAGQKKAIVIKKQGSEVITGAKTNKYHATIAPEKLAVSMEQLIKEKKKRGEDTANFETFLNDFKDAKNQQSITDFFKQMSLDVWVDAKTKLPRKMAMLIGTLPMETVQSAGLNMTMEYTFTVLTTNQPQTVEKPANTLTAAELFGGAFTPSTTELNDATTNSNTNTGLTNTNTNTNDSSGGGQNINTALTNNSANTNANSNWTEKYPCISGTPNKSLDYDSDGLNDYNEIYKYLTNPCLSDTDGDTHDDKKEIVHAYDPLLANKAATSLEFSKWQAPTTGTIPMTVDPSPGTDSMEHIVGNDLTLSFKPSQSATYVMLYGPTNSYGQRSENFNLPATMYDSSFTMTDGNNYYFLWVCSIGDDPVCAPVSGSVEHTFSHAVSDRQSYGPPKVLNHALNNSSGTATVSWETDVPATGSLGFSPTGPTDEGFHTDSYTVLHSYSFPTVAGKTYNYEFQSCAESLPLVTGCSPSQQYSFVAK